MEQQEQEQGSADTIHDFVDQNVTALADSESNELAANVPIVTKPSAAPIDPVKAHTKKLESAMKLDLRKMHALVGQKVDMKNLDEVLSQRLEDLESVKASFAPKQDGIPEQLSRPIAAGIKDLNLEAATSTTVHHETDVRTRFVQESIRILTSLQSNLLLIAQDRDINDPSNDQEMLGLMDQRMIHTMLEIVVCWGIYPCLLPGVGMPLDRRVRSNIVQKELFSGRSQPQPIKGVVDTPVDRIVSTNRLWSITEPLAKIIIAYSPKVTRFTTLGSILAGRHVPDMYAALLQLAYRPLPKPVDTTSVTGQQQQTLFPGQTWDDETRARAVQLKEKSAKLFHDLFWNTEAARSLESLTILLSSSSPTHPTPMWLKSIAGRFLSQILLRPGGVRVVLEYMQGGKDTVKLDQLEKISHLVTSVPSQMSSTQEYYQIICPELLEVLERNLEVPGDPLYSKYRTTLPSGVLVQTATFVVGKLLTKNPAICQVQVVAPEVGPLWKWGTRSAHKQPVASDTIPIISNKAKRSTFITVVDEKEEDDPDNEGGMDPEVASEYEVTKAILFLHNFLVGNEPSPQLFHAFLAQSAQGLYQLYEYLVQRRSVWREKAKEILVVYLRILDPKEAIEVLKAIVMRRRVPILSSKPWQNQMTDDGKTIPGLVDMGSVGECYFAPGPTGGAMLRKRREPDQNAATQLELDVDIFMDFLSELEAAGHEGEITGDIFMYLLDEYQAGKARGADVISPRRMLTMLQLILNMTEKLGPSILRKVTQIIGLANNILEHQVSSPGHSTEEEEEEVPTVVTDNDDGDADTGLLTIVLTLLSAILNENEHLSQQDRHLLSLTLLHLKQLSNYPMIEIRRVAHDLQTLIPTRLNDRGSDRDLPKKTLMEIEMEKYASALAALQDSLLPVRAHGLHILREMILAKSIVLTGSERELDHSLDIFVQHVQEPDSFIYLNAVKGLAALTDAHGPEILKKLMRIYANEDGLQKLDTRLRIGEALVQTVQRCGQALGGYLDALLPGLYKVMNTAMDPEIVKAREAEKARQLEREKFKRSSDALLTAEEKQAKWKAERLEQKKDVGQQGGEDEDDELAIVDTVSLLRSSALTILATAAESCPTALLPEMRYLVDWILSILDLDKQVEVRRAATLVLILLFRALGNNTLYRVDGDQLKRTYRTLRYVEQVDDDALTRAQSRTAIADLDAIVRQELGSSTLLESGSSSSSGGFATGAGGIGEIRYR
ncbi:transmembrane and coiled-coil domains-containing protein 7 [Gryganskiella cystojenkinii]|nr:transmembrane and coiled-coil domains-containing protein 7 [Gryganskiella cystojenkinii]